MTVDPVDDCTFYLVGIVSSFGFVEHARRDFKFSNCGTTGTTYSISGTRSPTAPASASAASASATAAPAPRPTAAAPTRWPISRTRPTRSPRRCRVTRSRRSAAASSSTAPTSPRRTSPAPRPRRPRSSISGTITTGAGTGHQRRHRQHRLGQRDHQQHRRLHHLRPGQRHLHGHPDAVGLHLQPGQPRRSRSPAPTAPARTSPAPRTPARHGCSATAWRGLHQLHQRLAAGRTTRWRSRPAPPT
jgi:hypothetical protein